MASCSEHWPLVTPCCAVLTWIRQPGLCTAAQSKWPAIRAAASAVHLAPTTRLWSAPEPGCRRKVGGARRNSDAGHLLCAAQHSAGRRYPGQYDATRVSNGQCWFAGGHLLVRVQIQYRGQFDRFRTSFYTTGCAPGTGDDTIFLVPTGAVFNFERSGMETP